MELDTTVRRHVPASPDATWQYVADHYFDHHGEWDPAITEMRRLTEGSLAVGTTGEERRRVGLVEQTARFEVTHWEPERLFAFRNTSGAFDLERSYTFRGVDGGTELEFRFRMAPKG